jgi:hypothetical protein
MSVPLGRVASRWRMIALTLPHDRCVWAIVTPIAIQYASIRATPGVMLSLDE